MADAIAGIVERLTFHWNEFPVIFSAGQGEFKDAVSLPVPHFAVGSGHAQRAVAPSARFNNDFADSTRSEEHTSELQSRVDLVCRLLLEKKNKKLNLRC